MDDLFSCIENSVGSLIRAEEDQKRSMITWNQRRPIVFHRAGLSSPDQWKSA